MLSRSTPAAGEQPERLPHEPDSELAVLSAVLNHPGLARDVLAVAAPEAFCTPRVQKVIAKVADLVAEGVLPEPAVVATRVDAADFTLADLVGLTVDAPSDGGALHLAGRVAKLAAARAVLGEAYLLRTAAEEGRLEEVLPGTIDRLVTHLAAAGSSASLSQRRGKVEWAEFWAHDHTTADWLVEPLLVRGRSHALYAAAKAGKTDFILPVAAALAVGRPTLHRPAAEPVNVVYLDYEMTLSDVQERLVALGYDELADLSHLNYYLLPNLPPLDTPEGGRELAAIIAADNAAVVIIDTTARALSGEENSADTVRAYYRHTGIVLKRAGVTSLRIDHAGKDLTKGQRGTSAKVDDVDVVWHLSRLQDGTRLHATHRRLSWVPEQVDFQRLEDPVLRYVPATALWPAGTAEVAALLDQHAVPLDASERTAARTLREAGEGKRLALIRAALRWRRTLHEEDQWAS